MQVTVANLTNGLTEVHADGCNRIPKTAATRATTSETIESSFKNNIDQHSFKVHSCCKKAFSKAYIAGIKEGENADAYREFYQLDEAYGKFYKN